MASPAFRRFSSVLLPVGLLAKGKSSGVGYKTGVGVGGTVTQLTSRATGVTLNTLSGQITTNNTSLAVETGADFVVTNSKVAAGDVICLSVASGVVGITTLATVTAVAAGSFTIRVINNNPAAGTAETGAIVINFVVLKGTTN